jgi:hypothetical protein
VEAAPPLARAPVGHPLHNALACAPSVSEGVRARIGACLDLRAGPSSAHTLFQSTRRMPCPPPSMPGAASAPGTGWSPRTRAHPDAPQRVQLVEPVLQRGDACERQGPRLEPLGGRQFYVPCVLWSRVHRGAAAKIQRLQRGGRGACHQQRTETCWAGEDRTAGSAGPVVLWAGRCVSWHKLVGAGPEGSRTLERGPGRARRRLPSGLSMARGGPKSDRSGGTAGRGCTCRVSKHFIEGQVNKVRFDQGEVQRVCWDVGGGVEGHQPPVAGR